MFTKEVISYIIKKLRVNESIRAKEVRLIGENGEQLGVMPLYQAREVAKKQGYDLVEIAPTAVPPVCRIMDYGKFKYEQAKKEREQRKSQRVSVVREVRLRPSIDDHDLDSKVRSAQKLLKGGDKVKVIVIFRGREIIHSDLGWKLLQRIVESVKEVATIERQPFMEGNRMSIILSPAGQKPPTAPQKAPAPEVVKEKEGVKP